jgi:hypothetical protein
MRMINREEALAMIINVHDEMLRERELYYSISMEIKEGWRCSGKDAMDGMQRLRRTSMWEVPNVLRPLSTGHKG